MPLNIKTNLIYLILVVIGFSFITYSQAKLESSEGFVETPNGKIWYKIYGSGEEIPLLLIHGGPGGRSCRLKPISELSNERPVILYDQLGSGKSDRPSDTTLWHLQRFVDELDILIDSLHLNKIHILGHSWGSALAVEYFLTKKPVKVKSLILVGPLLSTSLWLEDANYLRKELPDSIQQVLKYCEQEGLVDSKEYYSATDYFYDRHMYRIKPIPEYPECGDSDFNEVVYKQMWGPSEFYCSGNLINFDRINRLNEITVPVLLLIGEYDEVRLETLLKIQKLFSNAQIEVIKDAAHMSMVDQPEEFNRIIRRFIRSIK